MKIKIEIAKFKPFFLKKLNIGPIVVDDNQEKIRPNFELSFNFFCIVRSSFLCVFIFLMEHDEYNTGLI